MKKLKLQEIFSSHNAINLSGLTSSHTTIYLSYFAKYFSAEVKKLIKNCLERQKSIKFTDLWNIENWLVSQAQNAGMKSFEDFGHGSFIKFIITDKELNENLLSALDIEAGSKFGNKQMQNFSKDDVFEFVQQCLSKTQSKVSENNESCFSFNLQHNLVSLFVFYVSILKMQFLHSFSLKHYVQLTNASCFSHCYVIDYSQHRTSSKTMKMFTKIKKYNLMCFLSCFCFLFLVGRHSEAYETSLST